MCISDRVVHFGQILGMIQVLKLWHLSLGVTIIVQIHGTIYTFSELAALVLLYHCWRTRSIKMILQFLVSCLLIDIWNPWGICSHTLCRILIVNLLESVLAKVDRRSITLWCYLGVRQLCLMLKICHYPHLLGCNQFIYTLRLSNVQLFKLTMLVC